MLQEVLKHFSTMHFVVIFISSILSLFIFRCIILILKTILSSERKTKLIEVDEDIPAIKIVIKRKRNILNNQSKEKNMAQSEEPVIEQPTFTHTEEKEITVIMSDYLKEILKVNSNLLKILIENIVK